MGKAKKQGKPEKISKKELSKSVFEKLSGSLGEYHLKGKKLENRLEKVSRQLAGDIAKAIKKENHQHHQQDDHTVPAAPEEKMTRRKKRAKKEKQVVS